MPRNPNNFNRGYWPKGKHRHEPTEHWAQTVVLLASCAMPARQVARLVGSTEGSVRRWLKGAAIPPTEIQEELRKILS